MVSMSMKATMLRLPISSRVYQMVAHQSRSAYQADRCWRLMMRSWQIIVQHSADASACFLHRGEYKTARRLLIEQLSEHWVCEASRVDAIFAKYGGKLNLSFYQRWISVDWSVPPKSEIGTVESVGVNAHSNKESTLQATLKRLLELPVVMN